MAPALRAPRRPAAAALYRHFATSCSPARRARDLRLLASPTLGLESRHLNEDQRTSSPHHPDRKLGGRASSGRRKLVEEAARLRGEVGSVRPPTSAMSRTAGASQAEVRVEHSPADEEFFIRLPSGGKAALQYSTDGSGVLDLRHTEVPSECRGQGLGAHLAKAALDHAVQEKVRVRLTCTYLQHYVSKHPNPAHIAIIEATA